MSTMTQLLVRPTSIKFDVRA